MAYTKIAIQASELQVGDVFRILSGYSHHCNNMKEYEVIAPVQVVETEHPNFPGFMLKDVVIKAKDRKTGSKKTLTYRDHTDFTVWRKA